MVNKIVIGAFSRQRYAIFCIYAKNHSSKASEEPEKSGQECYRLSAVYSIKL
jgi:hypothetical protein